MRLAYACYWDARRRDGVVTKIAAQTSRWRAGGHETTIYLLTPPVGDEGRPALEGETFLFRSPLERARATRRLYGAVAAAAPDLVYLRYDLFAPPPARLARGLPTVAEVNSNLQAELRTRGRLPAAYERFQLPRLLAQTAGVVCMSAELERLVAASAPAGLPSRVIGNGVELDSVAVQPPPTAPGIRVVYMGDDLFWQGTDKVLELARAFPEWQFDLIGMGPEHSTDNVTGHGFLERDGYEPILARADFALGTLALHRKSMDATSALKVGLYLAYGLPIVIGYEETNLDGVDAWWLLRLPNEESNVRDSLPRIEAFAQAAKGRRVPRAEIIGRVSVDEKETERLAFFESLL